MVFGISSTFLLRVANHVRRLGMARIRGPHVRLRSAVKRPRRMLEHNVNTSIESQKLLAIRRLLWTHVFSLDPVHTTSSSYMVFSTRSEYFLDLSKTTKHASWSDTKYDGLASKNSVHA